MVVLLGLWLGQLLFGIPLVSTSHYCHQLVSVNANELQRLHCMLNPRIPHMYPLITFLFVLFLLLLLLLIFFLAGEAVCEFITYSLLLQLLTFHSSIHLLSHLLVLERGFTNFNLQFLQMKNKTAVTNITKQRML